MTTSLSVDPLQIPRNTMKQMTHTLATAQGNTSQDRATSSVQFLSQPPNRLHIQSAPMISSCTLQTTPCTRMTSCMCCTASHTAGLGLQNCMRSGRGAVAVNSVSAGASTRAMECSCMHSSAGSSVKIACHALGATLSSGRISIFNLPPRPRPRACRSVAVSFCHVSPVSVSSSSLVTWPCKGASAPKTARILAASACDGLPARAAARRATGVRLQLMRVPAQENRCFTIHCCSAEAARPAVPADTVASAETPMLRCHSLRCEAERGDGRRCCMLLASMLPTSRSTKLSGSTIGSVTPLISLSFSCRR
mmetsp:Transcript_1866/g.4836  ORF Transcript_1866/g.4836 Transcript_1866/m.4836 type:complete len:308 (+) Transcript_1866:118-1041(+)